MTYLGNPFHFWTVLTVGMFVYSLPYDEVIKMTYKDALDYSGIFPNIRSL